VPEAGCAPAAARVRARRGAINVAAAQGDLHAERLTRTVSTPLTTRMQALAIFSDVLMISLCSSGGDITT
jgi:hypothetical protein